MCNVWLELRRILREVVTGVERLGDYCCVDEKRRIEPVVHTDITLHRQQDKSEFQQYVVELSKQPA